MNPNDILRMAREAGWTDYSLLHSVEVRRLEQFAKLVAAHEREACAELCLETEPYYGVTFSRAIRERSEA